MFDNGTEISLTTELIAGDIRALDINSETHEIVTDVAAPAVFVGGALTFDGEWTVINQASIDAWVEANTPPTPVAPVYEWYIDIGTFFDRFGAQKLNVLSSTDVVVQAILRDVQVRKWVDLKRADVAQSLAYIGSKVAGVDSVMQLAILNTPVTESENIALRKLYFS